MNDQVLPAADAVAGGFAEVSDDFRAVVGSAPTLAEFLEILGWSVPADTLPLPLEFGVTLAGGKRYRSSLPSRVGELDDGVFVDASDHVADLIGRLRQSSPVTPELFAAAVSEIVRSDRVTFADVVGSDIRDVSVRASGKRIAKPRVGDVVAIPSARGGFHLAVVVARNRFGTALGVFEGRSATGRVGSGLRSSGFVPVYTDDEQVKSGGWPVVGHDEGLVSLFPADPPVYHKAGAWEGMGISTGRFGAAESPVDESLRLIDEAEADAVGLSGGTYLQTHLSGQLGQWLDARSG